MPKVNDKKFYLNLLRLHQLLETLIDLKNKECIEKKFSMFSYRDTIDRNKWTIIPNVKKMIGRYNCSLATIKFIAAEYKVWFAEDIPVPFGPGSFHGLPGLVLEAVLPGKYTIYASEINLNDPKIKSFPKYDFGKIIKYEESEKFIKEHMPKRKQ
ncbi:MAG: GLPGLI family protein [Saprospiraceae bacterium]|nr:GLPGLI family protein [Saprospiraceae bacterium]